MGILKVYRSVSKETMEVLPKVTTIEELYDILKNDSIIMDIDKAWEMIHYLLTNSKYPDDSLLSQIIYPKKSTIKFDTKEYEEAIKTKNEAKVREFQYRFDLSRSYLAPTDISKILIELKAVNMDNRIKECNIEELNKQDIYPTIWELNNDDIAYIKHHYQELIKFMKVCEKKGKYLLVC